MTNKEINESNLKQSPQGKTEYYSSFDNPLISIYTKDQDELITYLKAQISQLQLCINEKNKEITEAERQSNSAKINYVKLQEDILLKDTTISNLTNQNSLLKLSNASLKAEYEDLKKQYLALNNKAIELHQKIISIEHTNRFKKQMDSIGNVNTDKEKEYLIEITTLVNRINELEIEKGQFAFSIKSLQLKIEQNASDSQNELQMKKMFYDKTIENYKKTITDLNTQIIENTIQETRRIKRMSNELVSKQSMAIQAYLIQMTEIESKAKACDSDNFILTKKAKLFEDEIAEYRICISHKDNIIEKLQRELDEFAIEYKKKTESAFSNEQMMTKERSELLQKNEELLQELTQLSYANNQLQVGFDEMANGIKDANEVVMSKIAVYEDDLKTEMNKNKVYKEKIVHLKKKVNELYKSIEQYKGHQVLAETHRKQEYFPTISTVKIDDQYESSQRKTIQEYKVVLQKIEGCLFNNKKRVNNTIN